MGVEVPTFERGRVKISTLGEEKKGNKIVEILALMEEKTVLG